MQTRIHRLTLMMIAFVVVTAGCGDSGAAPTTEAPPTTQAPTTEAPVTTVAPTTVAPTTTEATTTTSTTTTTTTTTIPLEELAELEALLASVGGGWQRAALAAGTYRSTTVPLRLTLPEELDVATISGTLLAVGPADFGYLTHPTLTFMQVAGQPTAEQVSIHHPNVPPLVEVTDADQWTTFFADTAGPMLLDSGTDTIGDVDVPWWEITADTSGGFPDCDLGDHCYNVAYIEGISNFFVIAEDVTARMWMIAHPDATVYVWYQAPNAMFEDGLDFANSVVAGVRVATG